MLPLHLVILFLDWYDLDPGVAHLGRGVAQLSQVLSFLAKIIETLLTEALSLAEIITCRSAYAILLVEHTLS
ncbi:hypothetical protein CsSME_00042168 [Camellia sinensis var. sinensis]